MLGWLAAALCALALGACGSSSAPPMPLACTQPKQLTRALAGAPAGAQLTDGSSLSRCVERATRDADLQTLGVAFTQQADRLADAALGGDARRGLQLGFLIGAAGRGARHGGGVQLELVHRLEASARRTEGAPSAVAAAIQRGLRAGATRG